MTKKEKIIITGSNGTIGKILTKGLKNYDITSFARPDVDIRNYMQVSTRMSGHSAIIHLSWATKVGTFRSERINSENTEMFFNVYEAALEHKISRVIMASSVHADGFYTWNKPEMMSPYQLPNPTGTYGAHKVFLETLGRYYSSKGIEVICVRLGAIGRAPDANNLHERAVYLSENDGVDLIQTILASSVKAGRYTIMYAVSNNRNRMHDITNPFGWTPKERAEDF